MEKKKFKRKPVKIGRQPISPKAVDTDPSDPPPWGTTWDDEAGKEKWVKERQGRFVIDQSEIFRDEKGRLCF